MSDTLAGWEELRQPLEEEDAGGKAQMGLRESLLAYLTTPIPLWKALVAAFMGAFVGALIGGAALVGLTMLRPAHAQAQAMPPVATVAPAVAIDPTATPTATPTPLPTPTPVPAPIVWAPAGDCANVRAKPAADADIVACLPNGTFVDIVGDEKKANGFTWVPVSWPRVNDLPAGQGWMAYGVVVWKDFVPNAFTVQETPFLDANRGQTLRTLPVGTPLVVDHTEGGYAWVQPPNGEWGWVAVKDLDLEK